MDAGDRTVIRAGLFGPILPPDILLCIALQRNSGIPFLLRAIMHQTVLTDIKVARARAAAPAIRLCVDQVILKIIDSSISFLPEVFHPEVQLALHAFERLTRPQAVMDDDKCAGESEFHRPESAFQGVLGRPDPAADDGVK